jgi:hypothetical protein
MLIIGGDGPQEKKPSAFPSKMKAKPRTMIGGDQPDEENETDDEMAEDDRMDAEGQKDHAVELLKKGLTAGNNDRIKKALEAFVYACKE